jgi:hypothetical protein
MYLKGNLKTKTLTLCFSAMLDVMPVMLRVLAVVVKPGLLSAGVLKLIADTVMVPPEAIAGAPPAAEVTVSSIINPASVWVRTLNVPAGWLLRTFQEFAPAVQETTVSAGIAALAPAVVHVQTSLVVVSGSLTQLAEHVPPMLHAVNARVRKYPGGVVSTIWPLAGTALTVLNCSVKVPVVL